MIEKLFVVGSKFRMPMGEDNHTTEPNSEERLVESDA